MNGNRKFGFFDSMLDFDDKQIQMKLEPSPHILDTTLIDLKTVICLCAFFEGKNALLPHHNISFIPFLQVLRFFVYFSINVAVSDHL